MAPTLLEGDMVLVNRFSYWLRKPGFKDIVALKDPRDGKVLIKRIIKSDGQKYFVQGDNKNHSTDSRVFGMIRKENIVGKVVFKKVGKRIIK